MNTLNDAHPIRRRALATLAAALLIAGVASSPGLHAQTSTSAYPSGPITLVVPFPPGGPTDQSARLIGKSLAGTLGKPVVIENRPGAGGTVGSAQVAKAAPDGQTLLWGSTSSLGVAPSLYPNPGYSPLTSFAPVGLVSRTPILLVTRSTLPPSNMKDFVNYAKSHKTSYGSAGNGSINHLAGEWFKDVAKVDMLHVPYKGGAPALADMLGGQIDMTLETPAMVQPHVAGGRVRILATASSQRTPGLPEVPTVQELFGTDFEVYSWMALVAPAGTPAAIVNKLNAALQTAQADPDVRKQMLAAGLEPQQTSPEQFQKFLATESKKWTALVSKTKPVVE